MRYSLRSLQVFAAVARLRSVSKAADELGLTQSAVSHQLTRLSEDLAERLVVRSGRGIELTEIGRELADRLEAAFLQIDDSLEHAAGGERRIVRLMGYFGFMNGWLIPRLKQFYISNPAVDLQLLMAAQDHEMTASSSDLFVSWTPSQRGYWSAPLVPETLVAVYSANLDRKCQSVEQLPLITCEIGPNDFGADWSWYMSLSSAAAPQLRNRRWRRCSHYPLALALAQEGCGIALIPEFLAKSEINRGTLIQFGPERAATGRSYYLAVKTSRRHEPGIRQIVSWLLEQCEPK